MPQTTIGPDLDYLAPLEGAVAEIANTCLPNDPEYRADEPAQRVRYCQHIRSW